MTHIATHPPEEDALIGTSPLYKMFGYLIIKKDDKEFKLFFLNNTGYQIKQDTPIGVHVALFPNTNPKAGKRFCAIAYDPVDFKQHQGVENEVGMGHKIENLSIDYLEDKLSVLEGKLSDLEGKPSDSKIEEEKAAKFRQEKAILSQSCEYMKSDSFRKIYLQKEEKAKGHPKKAPEEWIIENVADLEETKQFIFGCGNEGGNKLASAEDINEFLKKA